MALPYLMEFPYECSEQVFSRYYANSLAEHVALSDPKIRRIFDLWKGTEALTSPLEKNEDLKAVLLEETPWVRQAGKESEARRNVGVLFDGNRLNQERNLALQEARRSAVAGRSLALVLRRPSQRIHHAPRGHGIWTAAAPRRGRSGRVAGAASAHLARRQPWRSVTGGSWNARKKRRTIFRPMWRSISTAGAFSWKISRLRTDIARPIDYFLGQAKKHWTELGSRHVEGSSGAGAEAVPGASRGAGRDHGFLERVLRDQLRNWGCSGRTSRALLFLAARADRDAGAHDRGVRRGGRGCRGGGGFQGLAAEAEADAGLENHQGHRGCGLRPAAAWRQCRWLRMRWWR